MHVMYRHSFKIHASLTAEATVIA